MEKAVTLHNIKILIKLDFDENHNHYYYIAVSEKRSHKYDKIDVSEDFDVSKTDTSRQFFICCKWYLLDEGFKFQLAVSNGCHDFLMMSMNLVNILILNVTH